MVCVLFNKFASLVNVLVPEVTGVNDLKIGAFPDGAFGKPAGPKSYSSQQYLIESPLPSVAEPVKENGVEIGIVFPPAPTVTTGL